MENCDSQLTKHIGHEKDNRSLSRRLQDGIFKSSADRCGQDNASFLRHFFVRSGRIPLGRGRPSLSVSPCLCSKSSLTKLEEYKDT